MSIFFQGCGRNLEQLEEKPTQAEEDVHTVLPHCLCNFLKRALDLCHARRLSWVFPDAGPQQRLLVPGRPPYLSPTTWSSLQPSPGHMESSNGWTDRR